MISAATATAPPLRIQAVTPTDLSAAAVHSTGIIAGSYALRPVMWWLARAAVLRAAGTHS
jgi:hypothetical protein